MDSSTWILLIWVIYQYVYVFGLIRTSRNGRRTALRMAEEHRQWALQKELDDKAISFLTAEDREWLTTFDWKEPRKP